MTTDPNQHERPSGNGEHEAADDWNPIAADAEIEALRAERDELLGKYQRALADFQNYQRRAINNEREAHERGVRDVVQSLLVALDHADLALLQDPAKTTAERMAEGVRAVRQDILKALQTHGVSIIEPRPNDPFDPAEHEAVMQRVQDGVEPGHVAAAIQAGFRLGERLVRPAKVIVAPSEA